MWPFQGWPHAAIPTTPHAAWSPKKRGEGGIYFSRKALMRSSYWALSRAYTP